MVRPGFEQQKSNVVLPAATSDLYPWFGTGRPTNWTLAVASVLPGKHPICDS
jgi:hypothetical protein